MGLIAQTDALAFATTDRSKESIPQRRTQIPNLVGKFSVTSRLAKEKGNRVLPRKPGRIRIEERHMKKAKRTARKLRIMVCILESVEDKEINYETSKLIFEQTEN